MTSTGFCWEEIALENSLLERIWTTAAGRVAHDTKSQGLVYPEAIRHGKGAQDTNRCNGGVASLGKIWTIAEKSTKASGGARQRKLGQCALV